MKRHFTLVIKIIMFKIIILNVKLYIATLYTDQKEKKMRRHPLSNSS